MNPFLAALRPALSLRAAPARRFALCLALLAGSLPAWACKPLCVTSGSVVHAAGMPPELAALLQQVAFQGAGLARADEAVVKKIAGVLAGMPAAAEVTLHAAADAGLPDAAAQRQAAARAKALQLALRKALQGLGAPPARVQVTPRT